MKGWKEELEVFGKYENVYCKMAGLVTEADWYNWKLSDFSSYISITLDIFGAGRVMFGSDFSLFDEAYSLGMAKDADLTPTQRRKLMGDNAAKLFGFCTSEE